MALIFNESDYGIKTLADGAVIDTETGALLIAPEGVSEDAYLLGMTDAEYSEFCAYCETKDGPEFPRGEFPFAAQI